MLLSRLPDKNISDYRNTTMFIIIYSDLIITKHGYYYYSILYHVTFNILLECRYKLAETTITRIRTMLEVMLS